MNFLLAPKEETQGFVTCGAKKEDGGVRLKAIDSEITKNGAGLFIKTVY